MFPPLEEYLLCPATLTTKVLAPANTNLEEKTGEGLENAQKRGRKLQRLWVCSECQSSKLFLAVPSIRRICQRWKFVHRHAGMVRTSLPPISRSIFQVRSFLELYLLVQVS